MDPFPNNAVAVEWEFRCHGSELPGRPWEWHCRAKDGTTVAQSLAPFRSLREAITDAITHGFQYNAGPAQGFT
jgi:hypothetical protein